MLFKKQNKTENTYQQRETMYKVSEGNILVSPKRVKNGKDRKCYFEELLNKRHEKPNIPQKEKFHCITSDNWA